MLRDDLPDFQTYAVDPRVKSLNIPLQSRDIYSQSPAREMTGMTTTSLPIHKTSLPGNGLRGDLHPSRSGDQSTQPPVHHLPGQPIMPQIGNELTRPIERITPLHPDPSNEFPEINSQGRSQERDPIKIDSVKPELVKTNSHVVEPGSNPVQTKFKPIQPRSEPLQPRSDPMHPESSPIQSVDFHFVKPDRVQPKPTQLETVEPDSTKTDSIQAGSTQPASDSPDESKDAVALGPGVGSALRLGEVIPPSSSSNEHLDSLHQLTSDKGRQDSFIAHSNSDGRSNINATDFDFDQAHASGLSEMHQSKNHGGKNDNDVEKSFHDSDMEAIDSDLTAKYDWEELDEDRNDGRHDNHTNEQIANSANHQQHDIVDDHENHYDDENNHHESLDNGQKNDYENIGDHAKDYDEDQANDYKKDYGNDYNQNYGNVYGEKHGNVYNEDYWDDFSED